MKPNDSEITTSPKAQPSRTGTPDGERGLAMPASSGQRLATATPAQVNNSLASLARQCGVELNVRKDYKAEYDRHGAFLGWKDTGRVIALVDGKPANIDAMASRIVGAFEPATVDQVEEWLVELSMLAPRRADGDGNDLLRLEAYGRRLADYPADVVREALLGRVWRFWPSWAELHDVCEELTAQRRAVRDALLCAEFARDRAAAPVAAAPAVSFDPDHRRKVSTSVADIIAGMKAKAEAERQRNDAADAQERFASYRPEAAE